LVALLADERSTEDLIKHFSAKAVLADDAFPIDIRSPTP